MDASLKVYVNPRLRRVDASETIRFYFEDGGAVAFELSADIQALLERCRTPVAVASLFDTSQPDWHEAVQQLVELSILRSETAVSPLTSLRIEQVCATAFGAHYLGADINCDGAIVILGASTDAGTLPHYARGASNGPTQVRQASQTIALRERLNDGSARGWYDVESGQYMLEGVRLFDGGDLIHRAGIGLPVYLAELESLMRGLGDRGARCLLLGGDHSVSAAAIWALAPADIGIVHFDAHSDLGFVTSPQDLNHGNVIRHVLKLPHVKHVLSIGLRGIQLNKPSEAEHDVYGVSTIRALPSSVLPSMLRPGLPYYISVDIDVLDPSIAPATAAATPDGFSLRELRQLIRGFAADRVIAGADLVEVQADTGARSTTAIAAAEVAIELMHAIWQSPRPAIHT